MAHDVPLGCAPDEYDDLISGTCSHLPSVSNKDELIILLYNKKFIYYLYEKAMCIINTR